VAAAPSASAGQALVDVHAISVNRGELHRLRDADRGWRPGWDFAGVVTAIDEGAVAPEVGERVFGAVQGAAWAERVAVPVGYLARLPGRLSFVQGAALPVVGLTAMRVLELGGPLAGAQVLVLGAAGGVGSLAVQLAARGGATVTAVVGEERRGARLEQLGASEVVVGIDNVAGEYDLILESAGGESLARTLALVAAGGTVITFGNSSREPTCFDVSGFYAREAELRGFSLWRDTERRAPAEDLEDLARLVVDGSLLVEVGLTVPWEESASALEALRKRQLAGKAVLTLRGDEGANAP
jgi:NADPH:quinone reductase